MPFIDFEGNPVSKGVKVTDEREVTLSGDVDTVQVDMTGLSSVDSIVNVDFNGEEVNGSSNITAEVADPTNDISGNTVTVTLYSGNSADSTLVTLGSGNTNTTVSDTDTVTVTAAGY